MQEDASGIAVEDNIAGILLTPPGQDVVQKGDPIEYLIPDFDDLRALSKRLKAPAIVPFGVFRVENPTEDEAARHLVHGWIAREVLRRRAAGILTPSETVTIERALLVYPDGPRQRCARHA